MTGNSRPASALIARISTLIQDIDLDCGCRSRVHEALARFETLENSRVARRALTAARDQRERIVGLMALLADLEEVGWDESDLSIYGELADLFEDIAAAAVAGAEAIRSLKGATP